MFNTLKAVAFAAALVTGAAGAQAQAPTTIKFTLGWKTQGSDAAFFVARDKGYFAREGLNVTIDQGEGSGATVTRIMGGAYDAG
ncbi:MAG: ABC transporter substrate-binding protein, partial [Rhodospirillales bacterium]